GLLVLVTQCFDQLAELLRVDLRDRAVLEEGQQTWAVGGQPSSAKGKVVVKADRVGAGHSACRQDQQGRGGVDQRSHGVKVPVWPLVDSGNREAASGNGCQRRSALYGCMLPVNSRTTLPARSSSTILRELMLAARIPPLGKPLARLGIDTFHSRICLPS